MSTEQSTTPATVTLAGLPGLVDRELGPSSEQTITQDRIDLFAEATGDWQWIHTDPVRAAATDSGGTIAHGFLMLSLIAGVNQELIDVTDAPSRLNYGLDRVRFPAPTPSGSVVRGFTTLTAVDEVRAGLQLKFTIRLEADGVDKPVCVADFISLVPGARLSEQEVGS